MNKTCLNEIHHRTGAKMIDFGGWEMPVIYTGIIDEHNHTRTAASAFDVSHMGRLELRGAAAESVLQQACTRNVAKLAVGRCGYAHVCNSGGGILDDVIVSRYADHWLVVCNAGNREKIVRHLQALLKGRDAIMTDHTLDTCMIAVQGPAAMNLFEHDLPIDLPSDPRALKRYAFLSGSTFGVEYSLFRTGYTGEDGFEIVLPAKAGALLWQFLVHSGERGGPVVKPAGLGARDTLRLEAGMPLYGHELHENIDPISAGCQWCVDLTKDFIGAEPIRRVAESGPSQKLAGLVLEGRRIARQGAAVRDGDACIGEVTSGTQSPTLGKSIAMAYLDASQAIAGTRIAVDLGAARADATAVALPFYKRPTA